MDQAFRTRSPGRQGVDVGEHTHLIMEREQARFAVMEKAQARFLEPQKKTLDQKAAALEHQTESELSELRGCAR